MNWVTNGSSDIAIPIAFFFFGWQIVSFCQKRHRCCAHVLPFLSISKMTILTYMILKELVFSKFERISTLWVWHPICQKKNCKFKKIARIFTKNGWRCGSSNTTYCITRDGPDGNGAEVFCHTPTQKVSHWRNCHL